MEMEGHHHPHNNQDGYSMADLRQLMNGRPSHHHHHHHNHFQAIPGPAAELFPGGRPSLTPQPHGHHYEMLMLGRHPPPHHQLPDLMPRGLQDFNSVVAGNHTTAAVTAATTASVNTTGVSTPSFSGLDGDGGCSFGGDGGTGRWPRQETLTLLEIRSRLDSKFKEANQKGPLWDEVSRIMTEEHGYQRSGKKCREKFENLYKYYKKTKEGKAGRQDGKNYRFFRQLEALYGDTTTASNTSVSLANHQTHQPAGTTTGLPFHHHLTTPTTSNIQDPCFNTSHKLCDSLSLSTSSEFDSSSSDDNVLASQTENESSEKIKRKKKGGRNWKVKIKEFIDLQMRKLVERQEAWLDRLTSTLEKKEQERFSREEEWRRQEEARIDREHEFWAKERAKIEARDAALMDALRNITGGEKVDKEVIGNKKRKENSRNCEYFECNPSLYNQSGRVYGEINEEEVERVRIQGNNDGSSPSNSNVANPVNDSCLRFFMADGETNLWENYGLKLNKGED